VIVVSEELFTAQDVGELSTVHPADLASQIDLLQQAHESSFVAQSGFHPDFARTLARNLKKCFENKPEDYQDEAFDEVRKILDDITNTSNED